MEDPSTRMYRGAGRILGLFTGKKKVKTTRRPRRRRPKVDTQEAHRKKLRSTRQ